MPDEGYWLQWLLRQDWGAFWKRQGKKILETERTFREDRGPEWMQPPTEAERKRNREYFKGTAPWQTPTFPSAPTQPTFPSDAMTPDEIEEENRRAQERFQRQYVNWWRENRGIDIENRLLRKDLDPINFYKGGTLDREKALAALAKEEYVTGEKAKMRETQAEQAQRLANLQFEREQIFATAEQRERDRQVDIANYAGRQNPELMNLAADVAAKVSGMGGDISWLQGALPEMYNDAAMKKIISKLQGQSVLLKKQEDEFIAKRLMRDFPDLTKGFMRGGEGEGERIDEERYEEPGSTSPFSGLVGLVKQDPAFQEAIKKKETQRFTEFPTLYPKYLDIEDRLRTAAPTFQSWLEEPEQKAFLSLKKPTPSGAGVRAPRTRPFQQRF